LESCQEFLEVECLNFRGKEIWVRNGKCPNQSAILLITYNFKMFMLFEILIKLSSFIDDENSNLVDKRHPY
jgi:hypothetical protein